MATLNYCFLICSALPTCKSSPVHLCTSNGRSLEVLSGFVWNVTFQCHLQVTKFDKTAMAYHVHPLERGGRGKGGISTQSYMERASKDPHGLQGSRGELCLALGSVAEVRIQGSHPSLFSHKSLMLLTFKGLLLPSSTLLPIPFAAGESPDCSSEADTAFPHLLLSRGSHESFFL